mmetsp:Transcript_5279/g.11549  ORF Transcript_5279/g.11549 Transcript_5279/m.11549 type:complete len:162 (-) Transcript_5279:490-975(-)
MSDEEEHHDAVKNQAEEAAGGGGLFGEDDDDEEEENGENQQHQQQQVEQYQNDLLEEEEDDILGLDDGAGGDVQMDHEGALLMRFCPHDSSMLYPKENRAEQKLLYACRLCRYTEYSIGQLIYKNVLKKRSRERTAHRPLGRERRPYLTEESKCSLWKMWT